MSLYFPRRRDDENGDRDRPDSCQGHFPFIEEQSDTDQYRGSQAAVELGDLVGRGVLQGFGVCHDGVCQVRQILFPEEGQGQFPQFFRQGYPPLSGFDVGREEGGVILPVIREEDQNQAGSREQQVIHPASGCRAVQVIPGKREQEPDRRHQGDVRERDGKNRFGHIRGAFFCQGKPFHQVPFHASSPTFQLTAF